MAYSRLHAEVQFGAQGRVVVPSPIRKVLGFRPGDTLVARVEDDHLVIERPESVERRIRDRFRKSRGRSLAGELIAERREEARREPDERES
ncbi:MAG: AbrB/MazE/SpoVT family DNA-binding domain-containing protein [Thiotrichales bacterium]|nr:AbrB/MazE/SpoVT family DNA-binding domain-containing protein [Thiotrichales bacterium]